MNICNNTDHAIMALTNIQMAWLKERSKVFQYLDIIQTEMRFGTAQFIFKDLEIKGETPYTITDSCVTCYSKTVCFTLI